MLEIVVILVILMLDQGSKIIAADWLTTLPDNTYPLIQDIFHLSYVENRGAAFGMLQNGRVYFLIVTVIVCVAIAVFLFKERGKLHFLLRFSLALIVGGALGNFIDRAYLGYVRDMFYAVCINFAVFNVADSAICVGSALLFLDLMFFKGKYLFEDKPKAAQDDAEEDAPRTQDVDGDTKTVPIVSVKQESLEEDED
ncbi:MAG: signal peptidase II [Clostridia bacterium]|nr:signal peptidase II [Clostridia bacterium]